MMSVLYFGIDSILQYILGIYILFQYFLIETSVQRGLTFRPVRHGCNRSAFEDHLEELRDFAQEWNFDVVSNKWNICQCSPDGKQNGVYVFYFRIIYNWAYHQQY